jgi:class 3 adenylate cyclase/GAF domain-containing protein
VSTSADAFAVGFDLRAERRRRLRRSLRIAVPVIALLALLGSIAGIGTYLYQANRADARLLTDDLLEELQRRIVAEVVEFLEPAAQMVRLAEQLLGRRSLDEQRERLAEPLSGHMFAYNPQLETFSIADPAGNFIMLKRMPDGAIDTKRIDRRGDEVESSWIRRDPNGNVLGVEPEPGDTYDPRTRPWYQGAAETRNLYWSDVYVFFTAQRAGITVSQPAFNDSGELLFVYAVDIGLAQLSAFLDGLEIGYFGKAMIIDDDGFLVAYPDPERVLKETSRGLERMHIEELGDPVLNRAFDRLRIDGPGKRELFVEGRRYINTASSLKLALGRDWTLLIVAPEEDFVGFVAENSRRGLYMSVAVLCLASLLAVLLVMQGLRADRNAMLVLERQKQLEAQSRTFSELAEQVAHFDSEDYSAVSTLLETVAQTVKPRGISIWRLTGDGQGLFCEGAFDKESAGHTAGMELTKVELPQFFESFARGEEIVVVDAAADPRTAELHQIYLDPLGFRGFASLPIVQRSRVLGAIWLEEDADTIAHGSEDVAFARGVANMLALRIRPGGASGITKAREGAPQRVTGEGRELPEAMRETELITGRRAQALLDRISREQAEGARIGAQIFEDVTVAVMQFTDPMSLAAAVQSEEYDSATSDLLLELETMAEDHGVEFLKVLGYQIVCAAGFTEESHRGAESVADFVLEALDHIVRLFARLERKMAIQIGIDSGPVMGSAVGRDRAIFNLWGDAMVAATRMAETSAAGQIQATESTYRRLREDFLFRVRGSYYLEGFGEFSTYFLTGRL